MGAEAKTTLTLGRQVYAGTAHLERNELRFRGDRNLRIALGNISAVEVLDGSLHVTHTEGVAILGLGQSTSAKWAQRIQSPPTLSDKQHIKAAIWVVHARGNAHVADTVIFAAAKAAGLTYTKVVRCSDTDTAEKLVIPVAAR